MKYILDTNVYAVFFKPQHLRNAQEIELLRQVDEKIRNSNGILEFYIAEITAMEIYSVLGEMSRGKTEQKQVCNRWLADAQQICGQSWTEKKVKKLKSNQQAEIYKLLRDIENQRGDLKAQIIPLNRACIDESKILLRKYANIYDLHSLDALIGGTVKNLMQSDEICFVTLDKKFRNVLQKENVNLF